MAWLKKSIPTEESKKADNICDQTTIDTESDDDTVICVNCKYHRENEGDYEHACFANVEEEVDYVTGEKTITGVEDCEDVNDDGQCGDFVKK